MNLGTPEADNEGHYAWMWDTHAMDYRPTGMVVEIDLFRSRERERTQLREALIECMIALGWADVRIPTSVGAWSIEKELEFSELIRTTQ
jgi:hypothetical protein